jgi:uncharacterized protein with PQ loop repeat
MFEKYPAGMIGAVSSLVYIFVGLPLQMYAIWSTGSVACMSLAPLVIGVFGSAHYGLHGYKHGDKAVMIPQIPNVAFTLIIIGQYIYYH